MKTVAMIPIKMNNERLPGKNIKKLEDGTPLIKLIQETLLCTKGIDEIYVFCSDESITPYLLDGIRYLKRPTYLDDSDKNCNDILAEFIDRVPADIYIASHATGPFTSSKSIEKCINAVKSDEYDSAFIATKIQQFLWQDGKAMNFDINHFPRTQDLKPIYIETPGAYVFKRKMFEDLHRRVGLTPYICEADTLEGIDIDNPDDFEIANALYMKLVKESI